MLPSEARSPPLEDLEAFVRVAETGSFTEAARQLRLPKSSVSRRIARLEGELGTALVVRTSRKVTLTEAGALYLERVAPALAQLAEASLCAQEERQRPRGHLRVSAAYDIASGWLPPLLTEFRRLYPEITIEMVVDDRTLDLVAQKIDVALRAAATLADSSLVARKVGSVPLALFASRGYLESKGTPGSIEELSEHAFALHTSAGSNGRGKIVLTGPGGQRAVEVRGVFVSNDFSFLRRIVLEGGAIGVLPWTARDRREHRDLVPVFPEWSAGRGVLYVVYPSARLLPAKVRAFRDFILERAGTFEPIEDDAAERSSAGKKRSSAKR